MLSSPFQPQNIYSISVFPLIFASHLFDIYFLCVLSLHRTHLMNCGFKEEIFFLLLELQTQEFSVNFSLSVLSQFTQITLMFFFSYGHLEKLIVVSFGSLTVENKAHVKGCSLYDVPLCLSSTVAEMATVPIFLFKNIYDTLHSKCWGNRDPLVAHWIQGRRSSDRYGSGASLMKN